MAWCLPSLKEESKNLSSQVFPPCLLVIHDAARGCQDHISKLSGGQEVVGPFLDISDGHIKPGRNDTTLVETASQIDNNLASTVIINNLSKRWLDNTITKQTFQ